MREKAMHHAQQTGISSQRTSTTYLVRKIKMASRKNKVGKSQVQGIDYDGMNQREVAEALGVSRVAVQQAEKRAIAKIKKALAKRNIDVKDLL